MSTFPLQIITPEKVFFEGDVQRVIVRTTEGDLGILAKHEKYVAALPSGPVKIIMEDGTERIAALSGGAVKVSPLRTAILANAVEWRRISTSTGQNAPKKMHGEKKKTAGARKNRSLRN